MNKIAYLGIGIMGRGMAGQLLGAGHEVTVWNRTAAKCQPLVKQGATQAETPSEAVSGVDIIMYCLANDAAVEEVVFGEDGILKGVREGQAAVDMSTVYPETSRREAVAYRRKGVAFLDAPVFGSKNEAATGRLWIVVGGDREHYEALFPILEVISQTTHYMGGEGMGATMKLVGNLVVALQMEALGEAMILATKAGLDPETVVEVLSVTDFRSPLFAGVGKSLIQRDFSTFFALKHMLKDANLIARLAQEVRSPVPASAAARETIKSAVNQGWGEQNASALIRALEMAADTEVKK